MAGAAARQSDSIAGAVLTGYYAAYYMGAKKPKAPDRVIAALYDRPASGHAVPVEVIRRAEKKKEET